MKNLQAFIILCSICVGTLDCFGQSDNFNSNLMPLYDVDKLFVMVESLPEDLKNGGLQAEQIQTDVELKLRMANFEITHNADCYLYINVNGIKSKITGNIAYSANIEFKQPVMLRKDARKFLVFSKDGKDSYLYFPVPADSTVKFLGMEVAFGTYAGTWHKGMIGTFGSGRNANEEIRNAVKDAVDEFINAVLAAKQQQKEARERYYKEYGNPDSLKN